MLKQSIAKGLPCRLGENNILETLSSDDQALIRPLLSPVELQSGMILEDVNEPQMHVYFPSNGVGSVVAVGKGRQIEVGLFGREGMSGLAVVLGGRSISNKTVIQITGQGHRIGASELRALFGASTTLRDHFLLFIQTQLVQSSQTALSNGLAKLEERLARWLLMCHDRIDGDRIDLTHDSLSAMLGVRRAGVTVGTHSLEGKGLIKANRGEIIILDRRGLRKEAAGYYGVAEGEYARLLGPGTGS